MGIVTIHLMPELVQHVPSPLEWPWPEGTSIVGWTPRRSTGLVEMVLDHPDLEDGETVTPIFGRRLLDGRLFFKSWGRKGEYPYKNT